jgi:hypothetical protein
MTAPAAMTLRGLSRAFGSAPARSGLLETNRECMSRCVPFVVKDVTPYPGLPWALGPWAERLASFSYAKLVG